MARSVPPQLAEGIAAVRALIVGSEQYRHAIADHFGMGVTETMALSRLSTLGTLSASELAVELGVTPSTVTALVDRLEAGNFVQRSPHPTDRRKTVIAVSSAGQALLDSSEQRLVSVFQAVADQDVAGMIAALNEVATELMRQAYDIRAETEQSSAD